MTAPEQPPRRGRLQHIALELAREPGHPLGDREHCYHLYLPLTENGHIDAAAYQRQRLHCRVRRFRPGEAEAHGHIVRQPGGRWTFAYDGVGEPAEETGFRLDDERFMPGEYVSIREDDGRMHTFQVVAVREE